MTLIASSGVAARSALHPAVIFNEQRQHHRRRLERDLWLIEPQTNSVVRCSCEDISAGGLLARAPVGFGLAVGQRYELRLEPWGQSKPSLLLGDSLGFATVIRTQVLVLSDDTHQVGFAMRFDRPQYLPL